MPKLHRRITADPAILGGKACMRGMRMREDFNDPLPDEF